ncbi:protein DYAD [Arachis stenosperma]|uniref:protein DYAD n=1 Tax=Arachis stenosperma TaxID=217475 RepID=UPI0025AC9B7F|nr:protein DYAD [Arachis stenosperma]
MVNTTTIAAGSDELQVGGFHEILHSMLPPDSPVQLKSVRIAMVSEIDREENLVSLRYPSLHSLRTHFTNPDFGKPEAKKIPALDEKCVMDFNSAVKALFRRVPILEFVENRESWAFWASPEEKPIATAGGGANSTIACKQGRCWSHLKFTGMLQWGQRRHVRFLGRHEAQLRPNQLQLATVDDTEENKKRNGRDQEDDEEEETKTKKKLTTRQCNAIVVTTNDVVSNHASNRNTKAKNKRRKIAIDRWSVQRYKTAEENMLRVMKEKGAVFGNPIMRAELRSEARKYIGDTGLLDHLLKHMAGKVAPGGTERFRRRHNAEGAMEYWLESADLVDVRRQAGVQDPYWTPPPGWSIGDIIISPHDHVLAVAQLNEIKQEILQLKQEMRELAAKKEEEALVTTPTSCLSNLQSEENASLGPKQEIYVELVNKKVKIEEQLKEISLTLSTMAEQLGMLKEPTMSESANSGDEALMQEKSTGNMESLVSGFQICKPKGVFVWPNRDVSSPKVDYIAPIDENHPASKPNTEHLSMPMPMPNLYSHVKPLAERRPLSNATLTHVFGAFSPCFSPPLDTP